ncbi:hypothetical protein HQQ94_16775 [Shewanella sp. VB17]|uniref:hypothetical protein n=1 Tax=Shewanella sp. VB17 TaxID=2739432 RepID=UPI001566F528|nr:hypothetical protein [Shewanella sp. VB17]NRD74843.1 hypothetical protein [Shewanella sp. VB17]
MSPLESVLAAAKSIANTGKKPSLALIKTKLGINIPMPILIQGLQQFKSMSQDSITQIQTLDTCLSDTKHPTPLSEIDVLALEIKQLKMLYQQLHNRTSQLEADYKALK